MDEDTNAAIHMKVISAYCKICRWETRMHMPTGSMFPGMAGNMDAAGQRMVDDAVAVHLRNEHGLMSVLQHTWELNQQADRSFKEGMREGESKTESALRKVVLQAMRDAMAPVLDSDDLD